MMPSNTRFSHCIVEIIADKDRPFSLNFTPKSIELGEAIFFFFFFLVEGAHSTSPD